MLEKHTPKSTSGTGESWDEENSWNMMRKGSQTLTLNLVPVKDHSE